MIVVNLFGAPGAGKSTGAAYIYAKLKMNGVNAELVTEYAKDKTWENNSEVFKNQAYIFGKQYFRLSRLDGKVDVVITDAPLLNSAFYNESSVLGKDFNRVVRRTFDSYSNMNYFVFRNKPYNPAGRSQTMEQSDQMAYAFKRKLSSYGIPHRQIQGNEEEYDKVVSDVLKALKSPKHHEYRRRVDDDSEDSFDREALQEGYN